MRSISIFLFAVAACGKGADAKEDPRVHSLAVPVEQPANLVDAPGRSEVLANCASCHTSRYITGQPRMTRKAWQAEVDKMKNTYGAPIASTDAPKIVDYLVATLGPNP